MVRRFRGAMGSRDDPIREFTVADPARAETARRGDGMAASAHSDAQAEASSRAAFGA